MVKPMKVNKVVRGLTKKGFKEKEGSNHTKYILYVDGKKQKIFTVISRGKREIPKGLVKTIMKQLKFESFKEFEDFIECPLTQEEYIRLLKERKHI